MYLVHYYRVFGLCFPDTKAIDDLLKALGDDDLETLKGAFADRPD